MTFKAEKNNWKDLYVGINEGFVTVMRILSLFLILLPILASAQSREQNDSTEIHNLSEIVIEGVSQYTSANKTTYLPDRNSKRSALNATDLLARMAMNFKIQVLHLLP